MTRKVELAAIYTKDTPKKKRFNATGEGLSVSIYVEKGRSVPSEVTIKLIEKEK